MERAEPAQPPGAAPPPEPAQLPAIVLEVTRGHVDLLAVRCPGLLEGLHLHGSIGFAGEFHRGSDVDFVAVVTRRPTAAEVDALRAVHADLERRWPEPDYDGFYVTASDLAGSPDEVPAVPGVLHRWFDVGVHGDVSHVTWRELRDHRVTVHGRALAEGDVRSDDLALHDATLRNLGTYWRAQLAALEYHPREASLPQAAAWGGLGAPRLVHLLATGRPTSKSGAGRWALDRYPQHRELLEEALRVRERPDDASTYSGDPARRGRDLAALMTDVLADGLALTAPPQR